MDRIKNNLKTILLIGITLILAGAAIFTAWKLYETRFQAIAPTAPKGVPAAEPTVSTTQCTSTTFTLATATTGPTTAPTATAKPTATATAGPTATATSAPTAAPTSSSAPIGQSTSTSKPTSTSASKGATTAATATPSTQLPTAGVSWPTIGAAAGGFLLVIVATLLAF